jgi:hypothetical protein
MVTASQKLKDRILLMCIVGFAIYALFNVLAMLFYPGGTSTNKESIGYSFFENFFSDLGMIQTYYGESKPLSLFLFASALILIGVVLIVFFVLMSGYFNGSLLERYSSMIGSTTGVIAGITCIGIAMTPSDLYPNAHLIFIYSFSGAFLLVMISYSIAILQNKSYPNLYAWFFGAYALVLVIYIIMMVYGLDIETPSGLRILATGQKITIYSGMLCLFAQILGAFFYNRRSNLIQTT